MAPVADVREGVGRADLVVVRHARREPGDRPRVRGHEGGVGEHRRERPGAVPYVTLESLGSSVVHVIVAPPTAAMHSGADHRRRRVGGVGGGVAAARGVERDVLDAFPCHGGERHRTLLRVIAVSVAPDAIFAGSIAWSPLRRRRGTANPSTLPANDTLPNDDALRASIHVSICRAETSGTPRDRAEPRSHDHCGRRGVSVDVRGERAVVAERPERVVEQRVDGQRDTSGPTRRSSASWPGTRRSCRRRGRRTACGKPDPVNRPGRSWIHARASSSSSCRSGCRAAARPCGWVS